MAGYGGPYRLCVPCAGAPHGGRLVTGRLASGSAWTPAGASECRRGHGRAVPKPSDLRVRWSAERGQSPAAPKRSSPRPADNAGCCRRFEGNAAVEQRAQPLCKVL